MLERPAELPLVLSPEQAAGFAQALAQGAPENTDPDIDNFGPPVLAVVKGEYRSSIIVYPENGRLPYNEVGAKAAAYSYFKDDFDFVDGRHHDDRSVSDLRRYGIIIAVEADQRQ